MFAGAFVGAKLVSGFKSVISAASEAQQSLGATETVFGKYADAVVSDSSRAAKAYGLSANTYRENANLIGSLFKNQGVATSQLAGKTKNMIATASDLAATFGGTTTSAVEALGSAFKGEFDPLEKYGISIKQSTVNTEAMRVAHVKSAADFGKLTLAQQTAAKQQATTNLVMKQSKDSAGAFAGETGTLAHQQQVLGAQFDNVKVALGTRLLPILTKFLTFLTENGPKAMQAFKNLIKPVQDLFNKFNSGSGGASSKMSEFLATAQQVWTSVQSVIQSAVTIITVLWQTFGGTLTTYVQNAFSNILLVIKGVFQVIQGIFNVFAGILTGDWSRVWTGIKQILGGVVNIIKGLVKQMWNALVTAFKLGGTALKGLFSGLWSVLKRLASSAWSAIKSLTTSGWNAIKSAVSSGVGKVVTTVKELPGKIKSALGNVKTMLYNSGKAIIQGLINGIGSMVGAVKDKIGGVLKGARNLLPFSPAKEGPFSGRGWTLYSGRSIVQGLIDGIEDKSNPLQRSIKGVMSDAHGALSGSSSGMGLDGSFALGGGSATINYNISVAFDNTMTEAQMGAAYDKAINAAKRQGLVKSR